MNTSKSLVEGRMRAQSRLLLLYLAIVMFSISCGEEGGNNNNTDPMKRVLSVDGAFPVDLGIEDANEMFPARAMASRDESTIFVLSKAGKLLAFDVTEATPVLIDQLALLEQDFSSMHQDLELWGNDRLVVIAGHYIYVVDSSDPANLTILGSAQTSRKYGPSGLPEIAEPAEFDRGCILDERYLFLGRRGGKDLLIGSGMAGVEAHNGADVIGLERITGQMGIIQPDYFLATPWLNLRDCVAFDDFDRVYISDSFGQGYWPMPPDIILYLEAELTSSWFETVANALQAIGGPDLAGLAWSPPPPGASDQQKLDNVFGNLNKFTTSIETYKGAELVNHYTLETMAPNDPPGPFILSHPELTGTANARGNGPIYLALSPESFTLLGNFLAAVQAGNFIDALSILLLDMRPHYCWESNPNRGGRNDFESSSVECLLLLPRYGLEGLMYYLDVFEGTKASLEESLEPLHQLFLQLEGYGGDVAAAASTLARYNVQICREYTWLYNRMSWGLPLYIHMIDFSNPSELGDFVPTPEWPTIKDLLNQIAAVFERTAADDLAAGGQITRDPTALIPNDFGSGALPIDFGDSYSYPVESENDPAAAQYGEKQGARILTWGTPGLAIESRLISFGGVWAMPVPGSSYWLNTQPEFSWDILRASASQPMSNAYHIGKPFPQDPDIATLPYRFPDDIPVLSGFDNTVPIDAIGLDRRTIALVDYGEKDLAAPTDGKVYLMDISKIETGVAPVELWRGAMEPGSRLLLAVGLPRAGRIFVIGLTVDQVGNLKEYKLWRIATDIPFTF